MLPADPILWLREIILNMGLSDKSAVFLAVTALILVTIILGLAANYLAKFIINQVVIKIVRRTISLWDDIFLEQKVFTRLSHFAPALIIWFIAGWALKTYPQWLIILHRLVYTYMLVIGIVVINSFIESWYRIYLTLPISQHRSIKGYVQIVKIIVVLIFTLLIISVLFNKKVSVIIAGLGVMASVIMLIFKDAILGFVASIQLSANNMVKVGDWITIPSREVDGEVADITLTTVKVRNFDKTIITVPTYSLVNESFQNWIGIEESGVRQIKRAFFIDMKSIRFAGDDLLDKVSGMHGFEELSGSKKNPLYFNSGKITNLGIFRMYAEAYLKSHPLIDKKQTVILRHRTPEAHGLPLQVYAFTSRTDFMTYENVQSEIFEHLLAILEEFGLRVFQHPSGDDFHGIQKPN